MKKEAFGELVISNQESWYRIAKSYLCNDADCADAIQNAIVHAFENLYSLRNDKYAKTWFIRILINECHQVIRENKKVVTWEEYQEEGREAESRRPKQAGAGLNGSFCHAATLRNTGCFPLHAATVPAAFCTKQQPYQGTSWEKK